MLTGGIEEFTCFVGTTVQEAWSTSEPLRRAADTSITTYAEELAKDFAAAIDRHGALHGVTPLGLAYHVQAVLQGAFVIAKAKGEPAYAREIVTHLKRYVTMLFEKDDADAD